LAGAVKPDLEQLETNSRNLFLTITQTDGYMGLENAAVFQEGSGLPGLVKSLHWEWPEVFCRAIDFRRDLTDEQISQFVLAELMDPDQRLLEVGITSTKRSTLQRNPEFAYE
jgi:hypothetical protein